MIRYGEQMLKEDESGGKNGSRRGNIFETCWTVGAGFHGFDIDNLCQKQAVSVDRHSRAYTW
jgi:hypothetical protein